MGSTRNLLCFSIKRNAKYLITLNFSEKSFQSDGSFGLTGVPYSGQTDKMANVVDLSEDEIQRLRDGGITINSGIMVTLPEELDNIPDSITYNGDRFKVEKDVISEHCTIMTCSRWPIGNAVAEAGA